MSQGTEPEAGGAATSHQGPSNYLPNWAPESHKSRNRLSMPGWPLGHQVWFLHSKSISRVKGSAIYTFSHDHRDKRRLGLDKGGDTGTVSWRPMRDNRYFTLMKILYLFSGEEKNLVPGHDQKKNCPGSPDSEYFPLKV